MKVPFKSVYTNKLFYILLWSLVVLFVIAFLWKPFFAIAMLGLMAFIGAALIDLLMLYPKGGDQHILAKRSLPEKFSNGDLNRVTITVESHFPYPVRLSIIDELPPQFQIRDFYLSANLESDKPLVKSYSLRPVERGEYEFGALNIFASAKVGFFSRRYRFDIGASIKVYPSFIQMKRYEIMAISNRLSEIGVKKIRRIGHHSEFDQIRDYIKGDDIRTINWKATARMAHLMVNQYQDERSQQVFCMIDMGRTMKMPFDGITLLDYAINTSLIISNIALLKHDKTGLVSFDDKIRAMLPARGEGKHLQAIMEVLYNQKSSFAEHNIEALYSLVRNKIHQRSLFILFTNFESLESAKRDINLLAKIASKHLLMVVFFENDEIIRMINHGAEDAEEIYKQAIAEKFIFDKKQIVKELERRGIYALLTKPEQLTVDTMNRYLEFKSRGLL